MKWSLLVLLAGCANELEFNVVIGPVEGDVVVYADGVAQPERQGARRLRSGEVESL